MLCDPWIGLVWEPLQWPSPLWGCLHSFVQHCLLQLSLRTFLGHPMLIPIFTLLLLQATLPTMLVLELEGPAPRPPSLGCLLGCLALKEANSNPRWHLIYMPGISKQNC